MGCKNSSRREFKLNFQEKVWRNADLKVWSNSLSPNVEEGAECAKAKQCNFKCNFAKLPQEAHTRVAHQILTQIQILIWLQIWIQIDKYKRSNATLNVKLYRAHTQVAPQIWLLIQRQIQIQIWIQRQIQILIQRQMQAKQ